MINQINFVTLSTVLGLFQNILPSSIGQTILMQKKIRKIHLLLELSSTPRNGQTGEHMQKHNLLLDVTIVISV